MIDEALDRLLASRLGYVLRPWPARLYALVREEAQRANTDELTWLRSLEPGSADPRLAVILDAATVAHTQFFRHPEQLSALVEWLRQRGGPVRIWCAGCATGEEAWSLAICAERAGVAASILATDVSAASIATARAGSYSARRASVELANVDPTTGWVAPNRLRKVVRFEIASLISPAPEVHEGPFDVIFCRNVLIYFTHADATALLARIAQHLTRSGVLVVAPVDMLVPLPPSVEGTLPLGWLRRAVPTRRSLPPRPMVPSRRPSRRPPSLRTFKRSIHPSMPPPPPEMESAARLLGSGEFHAAEDALRDLLDGSPDDARAWFLLGEALAARGEKSQAKQAFTRAAITAEKCPPPGVDATTLVRAARRRAESM